MATTKKVTAAAKKTAPKADAKKSPAAAASATASAGKARNLTSTAWPEGFGQTPADEDAFARGFPHLRTIEDRAAQDVDKVVEAALGAAAPVLDFVWPREVAARFVRAFGGGDAKPAGPVGDIRPLVKKAMMREGSARDWRIADFVFLIEAEVGADAVADAVLSVLEEGGKLYTGKGYGPDIAFAAGYSIRRAKSPADHFARLEAIRAKLDKSKPTPDPTWGKVIDAMLDGNTAFASFGWLLRRYGFVSDGAALADKLAQAPGEFLPDVRHAYLGGPRVIALYEKRLDELPAGALGRRFFHQLAPVKRAIVDPLMRRLAKRDDTKALATAWLG